RRAKCGCRRRRARAQNPSREKRMRRQAMAQRQRIYGWTIALTIWFTYLLSIALPFYVASVISAAMGKSLQLDKTTIGLGFSMLSLVCGFSGPLTALLLNRIGVRYTIVIGAAIIALGSLALATIVQTGWMFIAMFGVVNGVGVGLASN